MVAVVGIAGTAAVEASTFANSIVDDARARSIADAVALAGVVGSRVRAAEVAVANGAWLDVYDEESTVLDGTTVHVTIGVAGRRASAWASDAG